MYRDTYLSGVDSRIYSRKDQRYRLNLEAYVEIVLPRLRGIVRKSCRVADISTEGAGLVFSEVLGLPQHFYLSMDGFFEKLGCAEVNRFENKFEFRVGVRFLRSLDERWLKMKLGDTFRKI